MSVLEQVAAARSAARVLSVTPTAVKNRILRAMADLIVARADEILAANAVDVRQAQESGLAQALHKRLVLTQQKIASIAESVRSVADLDDPVGRIELRRELDDGLILTQVRVPIGVIGVIFESRPDALVQIASLAFKSGNAVILKGGKEAVDTNRCLHALLRDAILRDAAVAEAPLLGDALQLVETREEIRALLELDRDVDLMIPRGSNELVRYIQDTTRIPVLGHADGVCHLYIHADADPDMAVALSRDAKTQYPAVCNAVETLLVHADRAHLLPRIVAAMPEVEFRGCPRSIAAMRAAGGASPSGDALRATPGTATGLAADISPADDADWSAEYNDLVLAVRVVDSIDDAIAHINRYGSHHTDAIVASSAPEAERFLAQVDSSSVLWNASTRFADGFRYGLGAEVGISTGKIHARGPVGLDGLTTTQYRVAGRGQVVADYADGRKHFTHREL